MNQEEPQRRPGRPRKHADLRAAWRAASAAHRRRKKVAAYHMHLSDEWCTPAALLTSILGAAGREQFELDPCSPSNSGPVAADIHWTKEDDGLSRPWGQRFVWCNPPYSRVSDWTAKCKDEADRGAQVVALVFSKTGTRWWHQNVSGCADVVLLPRRLKFSRSDGTLASSAPFDSALIVWNHRPLAQRLAGDLKGHLILRL